VGGIQRSGPATLTYCQKLSEHAMYHIMSFDYGKGEEKQPHTVCGIRNIPICIFLFNIFCLITTLLTVLSMHFSGVSGLRVLPLLTTDDDCEVSRVRAMLLMSVAYNFCLFTTRPTILLLVYLPLNSINQHQDSDVKCV